MAQGYGPGPELVFGSQAGLDNAIEAACHDHTRGLCHQSDRGQNIPLEEARSNPPHCKCCGTKMRVVDSLSTSLQQLGMYQVICDVCP